MSDLELRLSKLELRAGDRLIVRVDATLTLQQADRLRLMLDARLPIGVTTFVLDRTCDLAVDRQRAALTWGVENFGSCAIDRIERAARYFEESTELAQVEGLSLERAKLILDRTYSRPPGEVNREIGQAAITLEQLAENIGVSVDREASKELERIKKIPKEEWQKRHSAKAALGIANIAVDT